MGGGRLLVGDGIWDLLHLQTVGPILHGTAGVRQTRIRNGQLFVLREKSIDVVDIANRKTLRQIPVVGFEAMHASCSGDRILARSGRTMPGASSAKPTPISSIRSSSG